MDMIDTSYQPVAIAHTVPQLRGFGLRGLNGPWEIARGQELIPPGMPRTILQFSSAAASAFHGARRNGGSIFWGVWWFIFGAVFPTVTPIVGLAQGFGQCKYNCRAPATVMNGFGRARSKRRSRR
jgi:hypothetical protein